MVLLTLFFLVNSTWWSLELHMRNWDTILESHGRVEKIVYVEESVKVCCLHQLWVVLWIFHRIRTKYAILLFVIWLCLLLTTLHASIHQLDWYCLPSFKKGAGTGRADGGRGCVARGNWLSVIKVIYWWSIVCDDCLKHVRLLTLISLFEYRNIGTRVLLVHAEHTYYYIHTGSNNSCNQQFAWFSHDNPIQICLFYIYLYYR